LAPDGVAASTDGGGNPRLVDVRKWTNEHVHRGIDERIRQPLAVSRQGRQCFGRGTVEQGRNRGRGTKCDYLDVDVSRRWDQVALGKEQLPAVGRPGAGIVTKTLGRRRQTLRCARAVHLDLEY